MHTVMIVDDEPGVRSILSRFFKSRGFQTQTAGSGHEALSALKTCRPDYLLLDIRMPDMSGLDVLKEVKVRYPDMVVCMITAMDDVEMARTAFECGATDYITKPFGWSDQEWVRVFFKPANSGTQAS